MRDRDLAQAERVITECKTHRPPTGGYREWISARPRHRNSRITAESLRGKPSSPREAPSTRPCSAKKSGAAMTGGTLCRLGGEVAGVGHFLPLFARLGVNRGRGAFLAELCSLP